MLTLLHYLFYQPLFNGLIVLYDLFGGNLGLAIVAIAAIYKIITIPLTRRQFKAAGEMKKFQKESKKIKDKYSKNKDKMNKELLALQSKYMPAQLAGCLPLIVSIIFLIQMRFVLINLMSEGFHAFNSTAYSESLKKEEGEINVSFSDKLEDGRHVLEIDVDLGEGKEFIERFEFYVADNIPIKKEEIRQEYLEGNNKSGDAVDIIQNDAVGDIRINSSIFEENTHNIRLSGFLFFSRESVQKVIFEDSLEGVDFFIHSSSHISLDSEDIDIKLDGEVLEDGVKVKVGEPINFDFLGMNLSLVGVNFLGSWGLVIPYLLLSLCLAASQFFVGKIQSAQMQGGEDKKKDKKEKEEELALTDKEEEKEKIKDKKKDKKEEELSFSEALQQSSSQMIFIMPVITGLMSFGYLGGAAFWPSGVSLFWLSQNFFMLLQKIAEQRGDIFKKFRS